MNSISILEAVNTSSVQFHGQPIITAMVAGVAYVAMKPIVDNLGMSWTSQHRKLLNSGDKYGYAHMSTPSKGGIQKMLCIPLKKLNGWLFSINPSKVRADIRDKLIAYQEECFTVLHDYWTKGAAVRKSGTTVDERTPLRDAVNMLVSKKHLMYPEAYSIIHQRFAVESIEDLTPEQIPQAIEYVHRIVLDGEYIERQPELSLPTPQFSEEEILRLCRMWVWANRARKMCKLIYPSLRNMESRLAGNFYDLGFETHWILNESRKILYREATNVSSDTYRCVSHENRDTLLSKLSQDI
ncbi:TPA: phage antirepressor N-terminal domain-containing protein [Serratia marcescens]|uniref:phage antirepressor N-terminal domain-containing protein n=1 Tax=Serratia marcescens TaxID=615 RepID=UPI000B5FF319|nr:phage antirepressor N-terminal domain-containing protein [Serratia marcescens]ASM31504.1 phage antirepressor Ant [Serratia marcescens]